MNPINWKLMNHISKKKRFLLICERDLLLHYAIWPLFFIIFVDLLPFFGVLLFLLALL